MPPVVNISQAVTILLIAFVLDMAIGDPVYPLHPSRLIGRFAKLIEKLLFEFELAGMFGGILLVTVMIPTVISSYMVLRLLLEALHPAAPFLVDIFFVYSAIASGDLLRHAMRARKSLEGDDIENARKETGKLVGRDTTMLDSTGLSRAVIESVAEGFVDGFLAPIFWYTLAAIVAWYFGFWSSVSGVFAILTYRTINTLDSMIGYRTEKYRLFGRFAARLDDVLNFIPARLSILIMFPAALICGTKATNGFRIALRDRKKHPSPNSAHPESFMAGALGIRLGGPTVYSDKTLEKPWLGDGCDAEPKHIGTASLLIFCACWISMTLSFIVISAID